MGGGGGGKDPSLEPLEGAQPFDAWTGTSDLRWDRGHPCSEEPFPIGGPPNISTGGLDPGVRCEAVPSSTALLSELGDAGRREVSQGETSAPFPSELRKSGCHQPRDV